MLTIAQSIAQMENTPQEWNNPGALTGSLGFCTKGKQGGFVIFCTPEDGWNALEKQIQLNTNRGLNLFEFFAGKEGIYGGYAPYGHGSNDPGVYAAFVSEQTGIPSNVPLNMWSGWNPVENFLPNISNEDGKMLAIGIGASVIGGLLVSFILLKR